jgi:hypothetical protein
MMGPRQEAQPALFYEFSLEDHVPQDHLLRSFDRFVDLSSIRVHLADFYSHMRCLVEIGASDASDNAGIERLIARIEDHLTMCNAHLHDENSVLHIALEARRPGASAHAAEDHDDNLQSFAEVRTLLEQIAVASGDERADLLAGLYRRFALFVAHDLEHMDHEERVLLPDLQAVFTDVELQELEGRIVAQIAPAHMVLFLDAMLDSLPEAESTGMLAGMKAAMPPAAFADLMAGVEARRTAVQPPAAAA